MVSDDELREMMTIHRSDYRHCPVYSKVIHRHDPRWYGDKKIHTHRSGRPSRIFFTLFSLLKRPRWLKWNVF